MKLAIDVQYNQNTATIAGVVFESWNDSVASKIYISKLKGVEEYVSGQFYRRELPCILRLLNEYKLSPDTIIIDGFVSLNDNKKGLGMHLYEALDKKVPIIGVAKNSFSGILKETEIVRGTSVKPLYITCIGVDLAVAKKLILSMDGDFRIPYLLKKADSECRNN